MGVSLHGHRRNEEILEESKVELIVMFMRRLGWYVHIKKMKQKISEQ